MIKQIYLTDPQYGHIYFIMLEKHLKTEYMYII